MVEEISLPTSRLEEARWGSKNPFANEEIHMIPRVILHIPEVEER